MARQPLLVCPGDRLGSLEEYVPGPGTYQKDGHIFASLVGSCKELSSAEGVTKATLSVLSKLSQPIVPEAGHVVTARVTKVSMGAASADILCVGPRPLEVDFKGVIRLQDVRATEVDKVIMYDCFRPGDIVRAEVLSLGDVRSYFLTTAKNELGVVFARSIAGVPMVPISWQEMQDPDNQSVEKRKVAKVT